MQTLPEIADDVVAAWTRPRSHLGVIWSTHPCCYFVHQMVTSMRDVAILYGQVWP